MAVTILVPIDLSPLSKQALDYARELGRALGSPHLILVHAYSLPAEIEAYALQHGQTLLEALSKHAAERLQELIDEMQREGISCEYISRPGPPDHVVAEIARERDCDYVVMTTHGRTGIAHAALGSTAERVMRSAPCPVVTLRVSD